MKHPALKLIPHLITLLNLVTGTLSIFFAYHDLIIWASYSILLAALLDYLDGFLARLLDVESAFGRELDSLADVVSFGLGPAVLMFHLLEKNMSLGSDFFIPFMAFLMVVFSAIRLARFNIQEHADKSYFRGLPVPANAIFISGLMILVGNQTPLLYEYLTNSYVLIGIIIGSSLLMVSNIPMLSFSFKDQAFNENLIRYVFIALSILLLLIFKVNGLFFIMLMYILAGVFLYIRQMVLNRNID